MPTQAALRLIEPIRIVYLPVNEAYLVMWHEARLAGPMPLGDARAYCRANGFVRGE